MDLFASAGLSLPEGGRAKKIAPRALRSPLFAWKVVEAARARAAFAPTPTQLDAAAEYARKAKKSFGKLKEEAVRPIFASTVLETILGYKTVDPDDFYSLAYERPIRRGKVDVALGRFHDGDGVNDILAPFELKGPATHDLDAPMPGRGRSPVQQAWDYAIDVRGARFVLVSNCLEIRLYGFGRGRDACETFDLARLDERDEHERLWLLLSAERLLGGETEALLRETDSAYRDVTDRLYIEYRDLRERLIDFIAAAGDGPRLSPLLAIGTAQKILDRVLFVAFAQRTDLLPERLLERAVKAQNEFNPAPIWDNFKGLFRRVDKGHFDMAIPAYNGGLFASDPAIEALPLPDDLVKDIAALGEWDYRNEVPVTVLGHIFEQSITDIERMKAESRGEAPPAVDRRKREGVVYTPDMATRFLVEKTIGVALREKFDAGWTAHGCGGDDGDFRGFWRDYLSTLRGFAILDPACGSGAFLVAAFDALAAEYRRVVKALEALGETVDFDVFDEIVTKNLYGVDVNAESIEITRLSLWLTIARRDHRLQNLEATIKIGDSLIDDPSFATRPFDWRAEFPSVFAVGGFDIVIGNPPYVRMEFIKAIKPYLEKHYVVTADRADLYAYFFERGVGLLKAGGRLGFISSSTFFRTGSGENLRKFLTEGLAVEAVVDFGDLQIFEGVTTYPAILTLRKLSADDRAGTKDGALSFLVLDALPDDLVQAFEDGGRPMPRARLTAGAWRFEDEPLAKLRDRIVAGRKTLGEVYGAPLYGIKTGLNEAFVIDAPTRDRLLRADKKSAALLKPFLRGEDVKRWRVEPQGLWLINTPKGKVDIEAYPAIRDWLLPFRKELEKRATKQEWWELQQAQLAYQPKFDEKKIVYGHFSEDRIFTVDESGLFSNDKTYFIPGSDLELLSLLNSKSFWFVLTGLAPAVRGGWRELRVQYVEQLPIPDMSAKARKQLSTLGEACTRAARARYDIQAAVRRRILDLAPPARTKLTGRLENWHTLDFAGFRAEVKRAFRAEIPLKERGDWERFLAERRSEVISLSEEISFAEAEIDRIVYGLFALTPDEIALLETSLDGQN